jgi:hypothetical protein
MIQVWARGSTFRVEKTHPAPLCLFISRLPFFGQTINAFTFSARLKTHIVGYAGGPAAITGFPAIN